jgi:hypothetical protein
MIFNFEEWYLKKAKGDVILFFKGAISAELITKLLNDTEERLEKTETPPKTKKKVYNIVVEALQNLFHHSDKLPPNAKENLNTFVTFFICSYNEEFTVYTGNFVVSERVQYLKDRLDQINFLSKEELKTLYKLILNNQEFSEKGGGGLGMIDIARKTGKKIHYDFIDFNANIKFFCLEIPV